MNFKKCLSICHSELVLRTLEHELAPSFEVDFLVESVRKRGPEAGLYGAKITGGGSGGTVAVFGQLAALAEHIPQIAREYSRRVGGTPDIFEGTSQGACEFGARCYRFGSAGWERYPL